jgi:hypothetical protein
MKMSDPLNNSQPVGFPASSTNNLRAPEGVYVDPRLNYIGKTITINIKLNCPKLNFFRPCWNRPRSR